jgi:alpha-1,2-mannosyltransferase
MSETGSSKDGVEPFTFGLGPKGLVYATTFVMSLPFFFIIVVPILVQYVGVFLGYLLVKKTEGRRSVLVAVMDEDNKSHIEESDSPELRSTSSEEWEKVPATGDVAAPKLKNKGKDWDGIIGFFHPFW